MNIADWGFEVNNEDHLVIGGCDSLQLAKKYGTPVHVIDKTKASSTESVVRGCSK